MKLLSFIIFYALLFAMPLRSMERVFLIGNSLTNDTDPMRFGAVEGDPVVEYQIAGGQNLTWQLTHPDGGEGDGTAKLTKTSKPWGTALGDKPYDVLVIQPYLGTTKEEDIAAISHWMEMETQQAAKVLIHIGWGNRRTFLASFSDPGTDKTNHSVAYFDSLIEALRVKYPERTIVRDYGLELLKAMHEDTAVGHSPFQDIFGPDIKFKEMTEAQKSSLEVYRDDLHMNNLVGYYLMHNHLRLSLGLALNPDYVNPWQGCARLSPEQKKYLNDLLLRFPAPIAKSADAAKPQ